MKIILKIHRSITMDRLLELKEQFPELFEARKEHTKEPITIDIDTAITALVIHKNQWVPITQILNILSTTYPKRSPYTVLKVLIKEGIIGDSRTMRIGKKVSKYRYIN